VHAHKNLRNWQNSIAPGQGQWQQKYLNEGQDRGIGHDGHLSAHINLNLCWLFRNFGHAAAIST